LGAKAKEEAQDQDNVGGGAGDEEPGSTAEEERFAVPIGQEDVGWGVTLTWRILLRFVADNEKKTVQHAERNCWNGKEVHPCNRFPMISQEGQQRLAGSSRKECLLL
jgi:hypothetical protein